MQAVSAELTDLKKTLQSQLWFFEGTSSSQRESQASGLPPAVMIISSGHHPDRAPWPQQARGRGTACSPQGSVENIARHLHKSQVLSLSDPLSCIYHGQELCWMHHHEKRSNTSKMIKLHRISAFFLWSPPAKCLCSHPLALDVVDADTTQICKSSKRFCVSLCGRLCPH